MKPDLKEVVHLYETNAADVVAMLRQSADSIEAGTAVEGMVAVAVDPDGVIAVFGWGRLRNRDEAIGILARGMHNLIAGDLDADNE